MESGDGKRAARTLAFIGGGQMASALIRGLLRSGWPSDRILVIEPAREPRERLSRELGVRALGAPSAELSEAEALVWAVKPQVLHQAILPIRRHVADDVLHVSIAAGVDTTTLSRWLGSERIVRAMPNTPAMIGAGVTGMFASSGATESDRRAAEDLFKATGWSFWVDSDDRIDAATAVSGSGPGYVFEFLASFQRAAQLIGFPPDRARELVVRTALGSLQQAAGDTADFDVARDRVASKGGTTEAGLRVLTQHGLRSALELAVGSALVRARQLSRELGETQ